MKLLALRCPVCSQSLEPDNDDVVTVCSTCYTAVQLDQRGLARADVLYAEPEGGADPSHWLPFWIFYGRVELGARTTQEGRSRSEEARAFWRQPCRFYVPAWELSLHTAREVGAELLQVQPRYRAHPRPERAELLPARLGADDARKLLEFIVLDLEVRRDDWLREVDFTIEVDVPSLWAVPALRAGEQWQLLAGSAAESDEQSRDS